MMKKSILSVVFFALLFTHVHAATYDASSKVSNIGKTLLSKNGITQEIKFESTAKNVDNSTFIQDRTISVSKEDLKYALNDNETASVVANEIGHIITGNASKGRLISSITGRTAPTSNETANAIVGNYTNQKAQKEADIIAVNLMANAGYNPLSAIVVLTRQTQTSWNAILGKPANADRAMNIYDYTKYAYPEKFKAGYNCNEYKNFLTYANTVLEDRNASKNAQNKLNKELAKYRKNSVSQISKFKTRGGLSGWDAAYGILNGN